MHIYDNISFSFYFHFLILHIFIFHFWYSIETNSSFCVSWIITKCTRYAHFCGWTLFPISCKWRHPPHQQRLISRIWSYYLHRSDIHVPDYFWINFSFVFRYLLLISFVLLFFSNRIPVFHRFAPIVLIELFSCTKTIENKALKIETGPDIIRNHSPPICQLSSVVN